MPVSSLKQQAEDIVTAIDTGLQLGNKQDTSLSPEARQKSNALFDMLMKAVSDVDISAAGERVKTFQVKYPNASPEKIARKLIRQKCEQTATVGAVTAGAGLIPGVGTAAAVIVGTAADIGATFKLQAELVLEVAHLYNYPLSDEEKQRLVLAITGISAGTSVALRRVGQRASLKLSEKFAEKSFMKALPVVGVLASAGTNVLSTYIIGQRADAYFRLGPEYMGAWADSLRAVSGVDERKITRWLSENGKNAGQAMAKKSKQAGRAGKKAGVAYFKWLGSFWRSVFRTLGAIFKKIWGAITFIPRKTGALFQGKPRKSAGT